MRVFHLLPLILLANTAFGDIVQPIRVEDMSLGTVPYFGQTFTATDREPVVGTVSFMWGFIGTFNAPNPDPTIKLELRQGSDPSGPVLASQILPSIPDSTPASAWVDFHFSPPVPLAEGQNYSLLFTVLTPGDISGSFGFSSQNVYAGGHLIHSISSLATRDLAFRVLTVVPEPHVLCLTIIATGMFAARHHRCCLRIPRSK